MNGIMQNLLRLQGMDCGELAGTESEAAALRAAIPPTMLQQYERQRARGKKGIAVVRNRVCTNCRMQVPIAVVAALMRGTVSQVCGNCGRYLCLPEPEDAQLEQPPPIATPAPKGRRRKTAPLPAK